MTTCDCLLGFVSGVRAGIKSEGAGVSWGKKAGGEGAGGRG